MQTTRRLVQSKTRISAWKMSDMEFKRDSEIMMTWIKGFMLECKPFQRDAGRLYYRIREMPCDNPEDITAICSVLLQHPHVLEHCSEQVCIFTGSVQQDKKRTRNVADPQSDVPGETQMKKKRKIKLECDDAEPPVETNDDPDLDVIKDDDDGDEDGDDSDEEVSLGEDDYAPNSPIYDNDEGSVCDDGSDTDPDLMIYDEDSDATVENTDILDGQGSNEKQ